MAIKIRSAKYVGWIASRRKEAFSACTRAGSLASKRAKMLSREAVYAGREADSLGEPAFRFAEQLFRPSLSDYLDHSDAMTTGLDNRAPGHSQVFRSHEQAEIIEVGLGSNFSFIATSDIHDFTQSLILIVG
jgi:hypothetical protein